MANISGLDYINDPRDFHIASTESDRLSPIRQKCPICQNFQNSFYCKDCIYTGFFNSKNKITEGYIDKQKSMLELKDKLKILETQCLKALEHKQKHVALNVEIREVRERTKLLKSALEYKKIKQSKNETRFLELKEKLKIRNNSLPKYEQKVQEIENNVSVYREKVQKTQETLKEKKTIVKKLVKARLQQLFKYIFPIDKVTPADYETKFSSDDTVSALAEASQTTFINDEWKYSDYMNQLKYRIVGPTLPASGDYSSYGVWVVRTQDEVPGINPNNSVDLNPAISISSALTYTAQLVNILSFYLDLRLPHKMQYSDICISRMNAEQFVRRIARLNANVLYLCLLQNVDKDNLISAETIHNVLQLLEDKNCDLGGEGPIVFKTHVLNTLEKPLENFLKIDENSDSDDGDYFPMEWEAVPHMQLPEAGAGPAIGQAYQMSSTQTATSLTGGLVNSAAASFASFWRGFTRR